MVASKVAKITISLSKDLLDVADKLAKDQSITRSGLIARLLEEAERERIETLMEEGYREMAEENLKFAEDSIPLVLEVLPEWNENDDRKS